MCAVMANLPGVLEHYSVTYSAFREAAADPKLGALAQFARQLTVRRGSVDRAKVEAFLATEQHMPGVVLAVACKDFSNHTNYLAGTEVDAAFAAYATETSGSRFA